MRKAGQLLAGSLVSGSVSLSRLDTIGLVPSPTSWRQNHQWISMVVSGSCKRWDR